METWKDIDGYEGYYQISNTGLVKSLDKIMSSGLGRTHFKPGRILKAAKGSHGYFAVALCKDKKQTSTCIHTILAKAFIPNPNNYRCINHKDGNKQNNSLENLEWVSHAINNKHAYDTGLKNPYRKVTTEQVSEIREMYKTSKVKVGVLAKKYKVKSSTVSQIVGYKSRING